MLELWPQARPCLSENLLAVHSLLLKKYQPYAELLPEACRPQLNWLTHDLLPLLVLLPAVLTAAEQGEEALPKARNLALAMELSFLARRVHDLLAKSLKQGEDSGQTDQAILVGDYLYTLAAALLARAGYNQWLGRIGRALCRHAEGKLTGLGWQQRPYVPETERLQNIHKENAESLALAAELAVAKQPLPPAVKQGWTKFGFYVGQAQGILLNGYPLQNAVYAAGYSRALRYAEQALAALPELPALLTAADELILTKLAEQLPAAARAYRQDPAAVQG